MAKKRRTPAEILAAEEARAREQSQRVRLARARANKEHADRGAVVGEHIGQVVIRLAGSEEHAGDARAVIDWAVSHMSARGQAARQRWMAPWDQAPDPMGDEGEPAAPAPAQPRSSWAKRLLGRGQRGEAAPAAPASATQPASSSEPEPPAAADAAAIAEWDQDATELAGHLVFTAEGDESRRKSPADAMAYALAQGIPDDRIPMGPRWETKALQVRGWDWRLKRWFAPPRPVSGTGC